MTKGIENVDFKNKRVIIRCDFNVPVINGKIEDDTRIVKSLKTINYVLKTADRVILLSHAGRIKTNEDKEKYSLKIVCKRLNELMSEEVILASYEDNINEIISNNKIVLLENTRFFDLDNKKESNCEESLSKYFASLGDIFINDAFGVSHRKSASNYGISKYLPSYIGFLVESEINMLDKVINPKMPFLTIMGGAKVTDKIKIIEKLIEKVDKLIITGGMAFTFLKVKGINVGSSIIDEDSLEFCKNILEKYPSKIILPVDFYVSKSFEDNKPEYRNLNNIQDDDICLDIGESTINIYKEEIMRANTIFWNGPAGVFEFENFSYGTKMLCDILYKSNKIVVVGGGDSAFAINKFNYKFENVSTGGGATLKYIEGDRLPGLFLGEENEKEFKN